MKRERDSSERATSMISAISISVEPNSLELSEEMLRMEPEVRQRLERDVARQIEARIEAMLFSAPGIGCTAFSYEPSEPPSFLFYRIKS
jgi:hypothetical protein